MNFRALFQKSKLTVVFPILLLFLTGLIFLAFTNRKSVPILNNITTQTDVVVVNNNPEYNVKFIDPQYSKKMSQLLESEAGLKNINKITFIISADPNLSTVFSWGEEKEIMPYHGFEMIDNGDNSVSIEVYLNKGEFVKSEWSNNAISDLISMSFFKAISSYKSQAYGEAESKRAYSLYSNENVSLFTIN